MRKCCLEQLCKGDKTKTQVQEVGRYSLCYCFVNIYDHYWWAGDRFQWGRAVWKAWAERCYSLPHACSADKRDLCNFYSFIECGKKRSMIICLLELLPIVKYNHTVHVQSWESFSQLSTKGKWNPLIQLLDLFGKN